MFREEVAMPALLVILIVAFLVLLLLIGFNLLGVLLMLVVAGLVGVLADAIVPGRLPWGFLGAILAGLVGSWLGVALFGEIGRPSSEYRLSRPSSAR
jgi:uncharacterized membrane protein YeaQ/YmgE (transglycosylase-associated protein family)